MEFLEVMFFKIQCMYLQRTHHTFLSAAPGTEGALGLSKAILVKFDS